MEAYWTDTETGLRCMARCKGLTWCGYVGVDLFCGPFAGVRTEDMPSDVHASCHGGITWSADELPNGDSNGLWWFGFDFSHLGDHLRGYGMEDVKRNCESLARALSRWGLR